jgi:glycosyltransferase involved in cell wall biosynthesis/GT2 family glycosyltransferase
MGGSEQSEEKVDRSAKRRVLFVSHEMTLSGAPILLAHLVGWLKAYGWEPVVVAPEDGPAAKIFRDYGVELFFKADLLSDPNHAALRSMILPFDLVVANTIAAYRAVQAAQLEHAPVLWYLHETLVALQLMEKIPDLRPALAAADALVTPTEAAAAIYRPFTHRPIHVVPHGYPEMKGAPPLPGRPFTFVTIATYESRKGQDVLLEAIHDLHPDLRWRASFQMAGRTLEKPFRDALRERSESIPNVQLLGPQTHEEALDLLNGADVLICASRDETMPIVLLEAMSLGKAIICTEVGGVREWLHDDVNALLVPPENPREMAIAIARCLSDRDLVRRLGDAAKQTFAEHFQLDAFGERFVKIAEGTIATARKKGTPGNYAEWVELYETLGPADRMALRRQLDSLGKQPLISVLLPVYNPDLDLLRVAVDSVKQQIYEQWELCIADDASTEPRVRSFLQKLAAGDKRIRVTLRERNGHIAACSNSAFALAAGEWCALLDQDDMLAEHALAKVALTIESNPDAGLIYSDEDKIDFAGNRSNPFFKMDWNPELFFGQNYVGHLGVYRTDLLRAIGGFREGFEGSQDYDVALRCVERLQSDQILHIPRILYHWRMVSGSLAEKRDAKPYAKEAARLAIADHLQRVGIKGRAEACPENIESHRVVYDLPDPAPRVDIIIHGNGGAYTEKCVESIRSLTNYPSYEIAVANERQQLNELATTTGADIILFLHADIEVIDRDWLREMASHAARPEVGVVGARLWYPDDTLQHSGYILGVGGVAGLPFRTAPRGHAGFFNRTYLQRNCSAVSAACLATRAAVFHEIGGFDNRNLTSRYQDIDFCLRAREHGLQVIWTPYANLIHHEAGSDEQLTNGEKEVASRRDTAYMQKRWGEELREDPFYSPNLSLAPPGFGLAFPPRWFLKDA